MSIVRIHLCNKIKYITFMYIIRRLGGNYQTRLKRQRKRPYQPPMVTGENNPFSCIHITTLHITNCYISIILYTHLEYDIR